MFRRNVNPGMGGRGRSARGFGARPGMGRMDTCRQGLRGGNGRGICINQDYSQGDKDLLISQKEFFQERIELINEQLENL